MLTHSPRLRFAAPCLLTALSALLMLPGCGSGGEEVEGLVPVSGQVTLNGEPLTSGVVTFVPTDPNGQPASGNIEADGRYEVMTGATATGVHPGGYKIRIESWSSPPSMGEGGAVDPGTSAIPDKYNNADASGLTAIIADGEPQTVDLTLTE